MLIELKEMDYLLYAIKIMEKQIFSFEINNFKTELHKQKTSRSSKGGGKQEKKALQSRQ